MSRLADEEIQFAYQTALAVKLKEFGLEQDKNTKFDHSDDTRSTIPEQQKINKNRITQEMLKLVKEKRELKSKRDISDAAERSHRSKGLQVRKAA